MASNHITAAQLKAHERAVGNVLAASTSGFQDDLDPLVRAFLAAPDEETRAVFRDKIIDVAYGRIERYGDVAAEVQQGFYALTAKGDVTVSREAIPREAVEERVRSAATALFEKRDTKAYCKTLSDFVGKKVNSARFGTVRGVGADARYALVPSGFEKCEWCIMFASRGFDFNEPFEPHDYCRCSFVLGAKKRKVTVDGYDQNYYLDCYQHPEKHPELSVEITSKQFGKKMSEHIEDFGYAVSDLRSPQVREELYDFIYDIIRNADEVVEGVDLRGQEGLCTAFAKKGFLAIVNSQGYFVSSFKEEAGGNKRVNAARHKNPDKRRG